MRKMILIGLGLGLGLGLAACSNAFVAPRGEVLKSAGPRELTDDRAREAKENMLRLYDATASYFTDTHQLPPNAPLTPTAACCPHACAQDSFSHPTWRALRFAVTGASHYQYEVVTNDSAIVLRARGDLDCKGVPVVWEVRCRAGAELKCEPLEQVK